MSGYSVSILFSTLLSVQLFHCVQAALHLSLEGYRSIPTDGSGRILITDIRENNDETLICFTDDPGSAYSSDWYLHPTSPTTDPSVRIQSSDPRGWLRNRGTTADDFRLLRLRRDLSAHPSVGGVFTCAIAVDTDDSISVGIYYAISSVVVSIGVVSAREGTFTVTCTSTGGIVLSSSLTGPGGLDLPLQPVGTPQYRGQDTYSVTTGTRTGSDGDTYHCTASNGVPAPVPSSNETLRVASPPTLLSAEQVSPGTTIRVTWSPPSGGAAVTGYIVHYSGGGDEGSVNRGASDTTADIQNLMNDGRTYTISVEAQSVHLSGVSATVDVVLCADLPAIHNSVTVKTVNATAVQVSWSGNERLVHILQHQSVFTATGAVISQYETTLPPSVSSAVIGVDDATPGYHHNISLKVVVCKGRSSNITTTSVSFDKDYFQIQFGPIEHCVNWGRESSALIEAQLQAHISRIIRERCPFCMDFSASFLRKGVFLCQDSPTMASYRSTIVSPGRRSPNATTMVGIIQEWVSESPSLTIDWLLVRVNSTCPAHIPSLAAPECSTTSSGLPNPALLEHINQVINTCTVRQLGQQLCHV